jgi:hypothetical protein
MATIIACSLSRRPKRQCRVPLQGTHHVDDALVDVRQFNVWQGTLVRRPYIGVDHLFARRFIHRQLCGSFQVANLLRRSRPLAQQLHKLPVQSINLISQFFQRHSILVLKKPAISFKLLVSLCFSKPCLLNRALNKMKARS